MARVFFPTGSRYEGQYLNGLRTMNGLGVYYYPKENGLYRGMFLNGKFHGYGQLKLGAPYGLMVKGRFENGSLVKIREIIFPDRLNFYCNYDGKLMDCSDWAYCRGKDRRYVREVIFGLRPVMANVENTTRDLPPRQLSSNQYDTEEGILNDDYFLTDRNPPLSRYRLIACDSERKWIMENCRIGGDVELPDKVCAAILHNNLDAAQNAGKGKCSCQGGLDHEMFLKKLCPKAVKQSLLDNALYHREEANLPDRDSSTSCSSFSVDSEPDETDFSKLTDDFEHNVDMFGRRISIGNPSVKLGIYHESWAPKQITFSEFTDTDRMFG